MTNCAKCGNPLQPGSTTCPICGTTAAPADSFVSAPAPVEQLESLDETPMVSPVPQVQPAPVMEPGPIATPAQPMAAQPMPAQPMQDPMAMAQPMQPVAPAPIQPAVAQPMMQPAAPMPEPTMMAQPAAMQPMPAQPMMPDQGFGGAPVMAAVPTAIPTPAIPAPSVPAPAEKKEEPKQETKKAKGKGTNLTTVVLVGIVALVLGLGAGYLLGPSLKPATPTPTVTVADTTSQRVSGFNFDMKTDWIYNDYYDKVIINNPEETVTIRLAMYSGVFTNINTTNIELSLSTKEGYSDIKAEKSTVGNRDAVVVNASNGDLRIQYYYIAHSVEKIITITTVYETEEAKKAQEENVKKLIESTTYTDEVQNAIQVIDENSKYFDEATYVFYDSFNKEETKPITDPSVEPTE